MFNLFSHLFFVRISALMTLALVLLTATSAHAQRRVRSPFHNGQKVEFDFAGTTVQGEIVAIDKFSGWADVRFELNGQKQTQKLPPRLLRPVKKDAPARPAAGNKETANENAEREVREWTDLSGAHTIKARFLKLADGKVMLEKEDGSSIGVPLTKLSEADQKVAQELAKGGADVPFVSAKPSLPTEETTAVASEEKLDRTAAVEGDWSQVRTVVINTSADAPIPADAAAGEKIPTPGQMFLRSPTANRQRNYVFEKPCGILLNRSRQLLIAASVNNEQHGVWLEACDLKSAKSLGVEVLGTPKPPVDLSPDGTCVACAPDRMTDPARFSEAAIPRGVEVWRLANGGSLVKRWIADRAESETMSPSTSRMPDSFKQMMAESAQRRLQSDQAYFISDTQVLSVNTVSGAITLWNIPDARAVYTLKANGHPAFSANRKQMALDMPGRQGRRICILSTATGETIAALPEQEDVSFGVAFRPDGKQIANSTSGRLRVWDLAEKKMAAEICFPPKASLMSQRLDWIDDQHLLLDGTTVFDVGRQIILWKFATGGRQMCERVFDGTLSFLNVRGAQTAIHFVSVPPPEALRMAESLKLDEIMAVRPGGQVSLEFAGLQTDVSAPNLQALTTSYEEQLKINGVSVVAGSPISLKASMENGSTEKRTYLNTGPGGSPETLTTTNRICRLAFVENGKTLWEWSMGNMTADRGAHGWDPFTSLSGVRLPTQVVRYGENGCFGTSELPDTSGSAPLRKPRHAVSGLTN